ncbi:MAG: hypothetical protein LC776_07090, partial [Acidobacteria bacterium]|nr:hypothetical protein [Acidobacteriota bacterium]
CNSHPSCRMKAALFALRSNGLFYERAVKRKIHPHLAASPLFLGSQPTTLPEALQATPLILVTCCCRSSESEVRLL